MDPPFNFFQYVCTPKKLIQKSPPLPTPLECASVHVDYSTEPEKPPLEAFKSQVIKILSEEEGTENCLSPPEQIHRLLSHMRDIIETFDSSLDVMLKPKAKGK